MSAFPLSLIEELSIRFMSFSKKDFFGSRLEMGVW